MTSATINALSDQQAIRVLALVVDHQAPLPDPAQLREFDAVLSQVADDPDLRPYHRPGTPPPSHGDLVRATLTYLAATRRELALVIDRAVRLAEDPTRFEPATLAVGGLVLLALQTEIKFERTTVTHRSHPECSCRPAAGSMVPMCIVALWCTSGSASIRPDEWTAVHPRHPRHGRCHPRPAGCGPYVRADSRRLPVPGAPGHSHSPGVRRGRSSGA